MMAATVTYDDLTLWDLLEQIDKALQAGDTAKARTMIAAIFSALAG